MDAALASIESPGAVGSEAPDWSQLLQGNLSASCVADVLSAAVAHEETLLSAQPAGACATELLMVSAPLSAPISPARSAPVSPARWAVSPARHAPTPPAPPNSHAGSVPASRDPSTPCLRSLLSAAMARDGLASPQRAAQQAAPPPPPAAASQGAKPSLRNLLGAAMAQEGLATPGAAGKASLRRARTEPRYLQHTSSSKTSLLKVAAKRNGVAPAAPAAGAPDAYAGDFGRPDESFGTAARALGARRQETAEAAARDFEEMRGALAEAPHIASHSMARHSMAWHGMAWHGIA